MKIKDLATELKMSDAEVLEKAISMGIDVSSVDDEMSDIDGMVVKNTIVRSGAQKETKVARRSTGKKNETEKKDDEPKVTVKAANIKMPEMKKLLPKKPRHRSLHNLRKYLLASLLYLRKWKAGLNRRQDAVVSKAKLEERIAKEEAEKTREATKAKVKDAPVKPEKPAIEEEKDKK